MSNSNKTKADIKREKEEDLKNKYLFKERVINFVRDNPVLYNTRLEEYKIKNKDYIWAKFDDDYIKAKNTWHSLKTSYQAQKKKKNNLPSGSGNLNTGRKNEFPFFESMSFIDSCIDPCENSISISSVQNSQFNVSKNINDKSKSINDESEINNDERIVNNEERIINNDERIINNGEFKSKNDEPQTVNHDPKNGETESQIIINEANNELYIKSGSDISVYSPIDDDSSNSGSSNTYNNPVPQNQKNKRFNKNSSNRKSKTNNEIKKIDDQIDALLKGSNSDQYIVDMIKELKAKIDDYLNVSTDANLNFFKSICQSISNLTVDQQEEIRFRIMQVVRDAKKEFNN